VVSYYVSLLETDGERERFVRLYHANYQRMSRLAAQMLGPGPKAEDVVHDTFLKLIQKYYELREWSDDRIGAWLMVVLKNTALDVLRKEHREIAMEDTDWEPAVPAGEGEFHALVALIRAMPEEYRRILELRFVAEWSIAEIAEAMDLTEGAVKTRIFRGRRMLVEKLRKEGYLDGRSCV